MSKSNTSSPVFSRYPSNLIIVGLVCLGLGSFGCQQTTMTQHRMQAEQQWNQVRGRVKFQLAQQQFDNGFFSEAARTATESLALDPQDTTTYALLAKSYLEIGKLASAEQAIHTAKIADLTSPELLYLHGVILEQRNQLPQACELFERARRAQPTQSDFLTATAECLVSTGKVKQALSLLDDAQTQIDDSTAVCVLSARIATLLGDTNRAIRQYRVCDISANANPLVAASLGRLLVTANRFEEAIVVLKPLLAAESVTGDVRRNIAHSYLAVSQPAFAKNALAAYVKNSPSDVQAQLLFVQASLETNDMMSSLQALDRAMLHDPTNKQVRFLLATVEWQRKHYKKATAVLQALLTDYPEDVEAHCLMGELNLALARPDLANHHFQTALQLDPDNVWARRQLGS